MDMAADGFVSSITSEYHVSHVLRELPNVEGRLTYQRLGVVQAPVDEDDDLCVRPRPRHSDAAEHLCLCFEDIGAYPGIGEQPSLGLVRMEVVMPTPPPTGKKDLLNLNVPAPHQLRSTHRCVSVFHLPRC